MSRFVAVVLAVCMAAQSVLLAVDAKKAAYFGGTSPIFSGAKDPIEGALDTNQEHALIFKAEKKPHIGQTLTIPYGQIVDLEYGQKAGRRVGAAIGTTVLLGPIWARVAVLEKAEALSHRGLQRRGRQRSSSRHRARQRHRPGHAPDCGDSLGQENRVPGRRSEEIASQGLSRDLGPEEEAGEGRPGGTRTRALGCR